MPMDAVEDIKGRLAIEDVIGEYVQLKRAGRNFKALSPFSNEKTASLMISPEKQIWHDFSSGKGGNMFSFVMEMEGLDFRGALELLARKAGVDLDVYRGRSAGSSTRFKERLYEALERATRFYQVQFSKHQQSLEYLLKQRAISKKTALAFRVGYAPNTGSALVDFLKKQGFTAEEVKGAGLSTMRYRGTMDMFRGRIMIPLCDAQGRVIGFTARQIESVTDSPKYINTPQTLLYDKSRHVFGLHLAKESIRRTGYAVVVEGNMDVIASHQVGVSQVVATAGTALTPMHLKTLGRFTPDIRLAFDQDEAGQNATERAIPIASSVGVSLSVATISGAKDPDELIAEDPKLWEYAIEHKQYALDWLIERYQLRVDTKSAEGKRSISDRLLPVIRQLQDPVEQDHYVVMLARLTGVSVDAMRSKLLHIPSTSPPRRHKQSAPSITPADNIERIKVQDHMLALLAVQPALRYHLKSIEPEMLFGEAAQAVLAFLKSHPDATDAIDQSKELSHVTDYVKILLLQYEELYQGLELLELRNEAARLQARIIEQYVKTEKRRLIQTMQAANEHDQQKLLTHAKELDQLLKGTKG